MDTKLQNILSVILRLLNGLFDDFSSWFEEKATSYTDSFVKYDDLSRFNEGVCLTGSKSGTKLLGHSHTAVFAPSGGGKTSCVIIPSIYSIARGNSSMIINDVKGECYEKTSGFLKERGYSVHRFDFRNPANSEYFNSFEYIKSASDANLNAELIIENSGTEQKGENFWKYSAITLLALLIRYQYKFGKLEHLNVGNTLRILDRLSYDQKSVEKLLVRTADAEFLSAYKAAIAMPEKTWLSILVTLRVALRLWQDQNVCITTSKNSIQFEDLYHKPCALFITTPIQDLTYTKPVTALLFNSLFNFILTRKTKRTDRSIFILLDEFALYSFPEFVTTISTIRDKNCGCVLSMQDELALTARYGQVNGHLIKTNCSTKIYFPNQPPHTCKELSQVLGKWSYESGKGEKVREVATPSEIRMSDKAIILIKNSPPMRVSMVPYYKNIWLQRLAEKPPLETETKTVPELSLIEFE